MFLKDTFLGLCLSVSPLNDLSGVFKSSYCRPVIPQQEHFEVGIDLGSKKTTKWTNKICMDIAKMKNNVINFKGSRSKFAPNDEELLPAAYVKDLGVYIYSELSWNYRVNKKIKKEDKILYFIWRNAAATTKTSSKLNLYKTMIMSMLSCSFSYITLSISTNRSLEDLQKRFFRWLLSDKPANYHFILEEANILQIPM